MKSILATLLLVIQATAFAAEPEIPPFPSVEFQTTEGTFVVELDGPRAPITVKNFVTYVNDGFYDGTVFHRVIPGFMAQAGGFGTDLKEKGTRPPVANEAGNGLRNRRGTIAMARTGDPHSATAQFYINLVNNENLDPHPRRWGYCVFGKVTKGMDVVNKIKSVDTTISMGHQDVPQEDVIIEKVEVS